MKHALSHLHIKKHHAGDGPHAHPRLKILDGVALANGIFGSLTPIPQIVEIYSTQNSDGVSVLTWALLTLSSLVWLIYGAFHRDPPIISSSLLSIFVYSMVMYAAVSFR